MYHVKEPLLILISIVIFSGLAAGMVVEITSNPVQTTVGGWANISVRVLDNSTPQNNTLVNFTATLGNLSAVSAYTNSSGMATIRINSTTSGMATINASAGGVYNTTNVTFLAEKPALIDINATQNPLVAGNITIVNLTAYDQYNNINSTVNLTINILISDILGEIKHNVNITRAPCTLTELAANQSSVNLMNFTQVNSSILLSINSTIAGNATITAYAENTTGIFNITYTPSALYSISYNPYSEITVNKTVEITVNAWDIYDNPLNGTAVSFNAAPPSATQYNSPIEYNSLNLSMQTITTDLNGYASTVFRADKRAGDNTINITVENINTSVTVHGLADEASTLYLTQTPDSVYANNKDAYRLKAQVVDKFLNPVLPRGAPITDQVLFTTISRSTLVPMNESGIAVTLVGPTAYIETKMVTATYKNATGDTKITNSTNLSFAAGNLSRFIIYANPDAVLSQNLNGNHVSTITVTSLDEWGHAIPGINITLNNTNTTLGNLTAAGIDAANLINTTTDYNGYRQAVFTSNIPSGNATINVSSGSINASTVVNVRDQPFLSINITFEPDNITSGDTVNMTTIISVEGELPISRPAASAMLVLDRSGSMDPDYYAGTPLDVALVIDRSGSMIGTPLADVKTASKAFINNLVSNSQVGVVSYSTTSTVDIGLTLLNSLDNKIPVRSAIDGLSAGGMTAMGEGMADANTMLYNGRHDARKIMIVLTDGNTNEGTDQEGENAIAFANANEITIYSIGLGNDLNEQVLQNIAVSTGGKYYNAPTSSDLASIYNSIAQEISDYDFTQIQYGVDGFTPYDYQNQSSVNAGTIFEDSFMVNETINDIKVQLDWINVSSDLNLTLISPGGHVYGAGNDTVGYYYNDGSTVLMNTTEYIWIHPLFYTYPDNDLDTVEYGNWTVRVSGNRTEKFNISTYIDKKSAVKLGSYAFISSFDESRGDRIGLALYSFDSVGNSNIQTSYLRNGSTWVGYFTVNTNGIYEFNLSWTDASNLDIYLYDGTTILNSSTGGSNPEVVSSQLLAGTNYHIVVSKDLVIGNDTQFTINVSSSPLRNAMSVYYDSNSPSVPRYRQWDGLQWSNEASANNIGGNIRWIVMQSNPKRDETILGTLDTSNDLNVQIWDGSVWGAVQQFSGSEYSYYYRGFDIAYEENSGDAMIVYNRNNYVPRYRLWDGAIWSDEGTVNATQAGTNSIRWVRLIAKPDSDEILLAYLDSANDLRAQIWNGSTWSNVKVLTMDASTSTYQSFDVVYEQVTGNAMVVWAQSDKTIRYSIWDGTSWSASNTIYTNPYGPYWIKLASDPNSDNILMGVLNSDKDVHVSAWNGSAWSAALKIEDNTYEYDKRIMDVAFEQSSGIGLVVWGDSTSTPKYRTWNGSWSPEYSASNLGGSGYTRWVQLRPDPFSNKMFLMTSDGAPSNGDNNINIQQWNGTVWTARSNVETDSYSYKECFDLAYQRHTISIEQTPMSWTEWYAMVTSTLNDSIAHLNNSIDTMTADGLTAIDEGLYLANNQFSTVSGNSTIVLMTDGLDNAGYHSMLLEAERARQNHIVIYTIGFGKNESEVDPVLSEIADITDGKYYFAPDADTLKSIFRGIAANLTNFTAEGPTLNLHLPHNYITNLSLATATYITNSSNSTTGNATSFIAPVFPQKGNAEPNITCVGNISILAWELPSLMPGEKWGVWYQLIVQGAGYVPLILPSSNITYTDMNGTFINVNIVYEGGVSVGGSGADVNYIALGNMQLNANPSVVFIGDPSRIMVKATYDEGSPAIADATLYSNLGYFNNLENPLDNLTVSGSNFVNFTSATAGQARINAICSNGNNSVNGSVMVVVRPRGRITVT
jgi:Mg-chelatase subunit ChlD